MTVPSGFVSRRRRTRRRSLLAGLPAQFIVRAGALEAFRSLDGRGTCPFRDCDGTSHSPSALRAISRGRCDLKSALPPCVGGFVQHSYIVATTELHSQEVFCGCVVATNRLRCRQWRKPRKSVAKVRQGRRRSDARHGRAETGIRRGSIPGWTRRVSVASPAGGTGSGRSARAQVIDPFIRSYGWMD